MKYSELCYLKKYVNKDVDPRSYEELLKDGALAGDPVCQYGMINATYPKEERAEKRKELLEVLRSIAHEDREAAYIVAMYSYKQNMHKFPNEEYVRYLTLAAEQDHLMAINFLASEYGRGLHVPRDLDKRDELRLRAAELGDSFQQYRMGIAFEEGKRREVNLEKAIEWYKKAAAQGFHYAVESLGRLCMKEDPDRAEAYFKKAFTPYCNNASYYMGLLCEQRGDMAGALQHYADCLGPWNTEPPADRHLRATADLCAKAALALAKAHHHGNAVKVDIMRAVYYYSIAAYFGSKEAVEELAAHQRMLKEPEATYLSTAVLAWRKTLLLREDSLRLQKNLYGD